MDDFGGNALVIKNAYDVEIFSSNGMGVINGQGYIARKTSSCQNARFVRFVNSSYVSIHDILLVDSPTFHLVFNRVSNLHAFESLSVVPILVEPMELTWAVLITVICIISRSRTEMNVSVSNALPRTYP
jgi:hypothetical protein